MVAKTINQQDLASGVSPADTAAAALTDDEIKNILDRLQAIDFDKLETKDQTIHVRVMQALLVKIVQRHDLMVAARQDAAERTRAAIAAASGAQLATMLAKLDKDLRPEPTRRRWRFGW